MATFEEFRLLLVFYNDANEDFLLLYEMFPSKNPNFPYDEYSRFDVDITRVKLSAKHNSGLTQRTVLAEALRIPT